MFQEMKRYRGALCQQ